MPVVAVVMQLCTAAAVCVGVERDVAVEGFHTTHTVVLRPAQRAESAVEAAVRAGCLALHVREVVPHALIFDQYDTLRSGLQFEANDTTLLGLPQYLELPVPLLPSSVPPFSVSFTSAARSMQYRLHARYQAPAEGPAQLCLNHTSATVVCDGSAPSCGGVCASLDTACGTELQPQLLPPACWHVPTALLADQARLAAHTGQVTAALMWACASSLALAAWVSP